MSRLAHVIVVCAPLAVLGCGHSPTRPADVVVSPDAAANGCELIGRVQGRAATGPLSLQEAADNAEADLRAAAARRGATYVRATHRAEPGMTTVVVEGEAYRCD